MAALKHDLALFSEILDGTDKDCTSIDMRMTAEHLVLLLGRLIPAFNMVIADLYMTDVSELERDEAVPALASFPSLSASVRDLRQTWERLEQRDYTDAHDRTTTAMEIALAAAELKR